MKVLCLLLLTLMGAVAYCQAGSIPEQKIKCDASFKMPSAMDTIRSEKDLIYGISTTASAGTVYKLTTTSQPFTGVFIELDDKGKPSQLETYVNGKLHGNYRDYKRGEERVYRDNKVICPPPN